MARFRVEAVLDQVSGMYCAAVYFPAYSIEPIIISKPAYVTEQAVLDDAQRIFKAAAPDQDVSIVAPGMLQAHKLH